MREPEGVTYSRLRGWVYLLPDTERKSWVWYVMNIEVNFTNTLLTRSYLRVYYVFKIMGLKNFFKDSMRKGLYIFIGDIADK